MRLFVAGASGRCGRQVVQQGRERGHDVTALSRPDTPFDSPEGVRVVRGEVLDAEMVQRALPEHGAVISCLGIRRVRPAHPWSPLASPSDFAECSARVLVDAMKRSAVRRIIAVSAAGVGDSAPDLPLVMRFLVRYSNVGLSYRDLERMERVYRHSGLDWLAVRPITLANGRPTGNVREKARYKTFSRVRRADVATYLLDAVESDRPFRHHTVVIG
ncbi:MAG: NAD(P)H-binding protein [Acidobacteriota bacterium]|nr:MAG: NAD(P)H-binding protein [Acidobacteriota bacterium]